MNIESIKTLAVQNLSKVTIQAKKHSPVILTSVGIAGLVTAGILAARSSTKLEPVITEHEKSVEHVNDSVEAEVLTQKEAQKEKLGIYFDTSKELVKLYGPAITLAFASAVCIVGAHHIQHRRTIAYAAALKVTESAFEKYRERVVEEFGEEKDREYRQGVYTETTKDPETGKKKTVKVQKFGHGSSPYARVFDKTNVNWRDSDAGLNLMFLRFTENWANVELSTRGYLMLNDLYRQLGMDATPEGQIVGWVYKPVAGRPGDGYVDLGLSEITNDDILEMLDNNAGLQLDFNVDGVVYDLI